MPDPEINQASDFMEQGKLEEAAAILGKYVCHRKPDSFGAWSLLRISPLAKKRNSRLPRSDAQAVHAKCASGNV